MIDSLLNQAMSLATQMSDGTFPMPDFDDSVNLGTPSEAIKKARKRLQEIEEEKLVDLKEQIAAVRAEVAAEAAVVDRAVYDISEELEKGETRESLAARRSAGEVAREIQQLKQRELDELRDQLNRERRAILKRHDRLMSWALNIEVATRANQISYIRNNGPDRMNAEKTEKAFRNVLSFKTFAEEILGQPMANEVFEAITTFPVPPTLEEALWLQLTERGRQTFAEHEPLSAQLTETNDKEATA